MPRNSKAEAETERFDHEGRDLEEAKFQAPEVEYDDNDDYVAGDSYKDIDQAELQQPHWRLLQAISGEVKRSEPQYIEGAKEGQWFDTIRKELFDEIVVVLVDWRTAFLEWKLPRGAGGFMGDHGTKAEAASILAHCHLDREKGILLTGEGSELVKTAIRYCLVVGGKRPGEKDFEMGMCRPAILSFFKTSETAGKAWLTDVTLEVRLPDGSMGQAKPWVRTYIIGSEPKRNDRGSWVIPKISRYIMRRELPNANIVGATAVKQERMLEKELSRVIMRTDDEARPNFAGTTVALAPSR